jgi:hypothetical protein
MCWMVSHILGIRSGRYPLPGFRAMTVCGPATTGGEVPGRQQFAKAPELSGGQNANPENPRAFLRSEIGFKALPEFRYSLESRQILPGGRNDSQNSRH